MNTFGNILWLIFGGLLIAIQYVICSLLLMVTIVGIPFGLQTIKLASLALWPFGREVRSRPSSDGCLAIFMNVLWILLGGLCIALTHLAFALILTLTIIGVPFALQHVKLAGLAVVPFGKEIVESD